VLDADGQPVPLRRLDSDDPNGILHVGMTGRGQTNLRNRAVTFQQAALRGKAAHQAGCNFFFYNYQRRIPLDGLYVDYFVTSTHEAARTLERDLQVEYWVRFLDLPPLDGQV
jgi:hypothetical protein